MLLAGHDCVTNTPPTGQCDPGTTTALPPATNMIRSAAVYIDDITVITRWLKTSTPANTGGFGHLTPNKHKHKHKHTPTPTHTRLTALYPGLPG